jgi:crotonobetainyl-CoA:carnitine CoA-transferase CaiB-like acyl-CoA transferase
VRPVLTVEQTLALKHTATREMQVELGDYRGAGIPAKLSRTPGTVRMPPPGLGEHSTEVLTRFGYTPAQIEALFDARVVK